MAGRRLVRAGSRFRRQISITLSAGRVSLSKEIGVPGQPGRKRSVEDEVKFFKYHGLGNDYLVIDPADIDTAVTGEGPAAELAGDSAGGLTKEMIRALCHRHYGLGSDGILLGPRPTADGFGVRIFNPDGSEAEKSGNGLRIFAKTLFDEGYTKQKKFTIDTPGGIARAHITEETNNKASRIEVEMGKAIFKSQDIPVNINKEECMGYSVTILDKTFDIHCVSVGNPHCVIIQDQINKEEVLKYGPVLENLPIFPNRINVQFAKKCNDNEAEIEIWERGAGYTLASGSSSCAVAAILNKAGLTGNEIRIKMPGGILDIRIEKDQTIFMTGEVRKIASGHLDDELILDLQ